MICKVISTRYAYALCFDKLQVHYRYSLSHLTMPILIDITLNSFV